jgi:hypothetical protein
MEEARVGAVNADWGKERKQRHFWSGDESSP